jgi:hypothetical protein
MGTPRRTDSAGEGDMGTKERQIRARKRKRWLRNKQLRRSEEQLRANAAAPVDCQEIGTAQDRAAEADKRAASPDSAQPGLITPDSVQGSGGRSSESGLTPVGEAKLMSRAVRRGWIKPTEWGEWPVHQTLEHFEQQKQQRPLTGMERAIHATMKDLDSSNARVRGLAVGSLMKLVDQNISLKKHEERMDFQERVLEARTGELTENNSLPDCGGVRISIPHNFRDALPPGTICVEIDNREFPKYRPDGTIDYGDELPPEDGGP